MSRLTTSAVRATPLTGDCSADHASPSYSPSKSVPWLHGTYWCGNHSLAVASVPLELARRDRLELPDEVGVRAVCDGGHPAS